MKLLSRLLIPFQRNRTAQRSTIYEIFTRNRRKDIHKWHHYFAAYETYLAPFRMQPITVLEIGLWRGGSLRMWREYFGPRTRICGIDIDPTAATFERDGYDIYIGDQADRQFLRHVREEIGQIDIVIDDGGHTMSQQVNAFEELYPVTKHLYIVEDTHTSYWPAFQDRAAGTFMEYAKGKADALSEWHLQPESWNTYAIPPTHRTKSVAVSQFCAETRAVHFYDSMVVFEKGENMPRWHEIR